MKATFRNITIVFLIVFAILSLATVFAKLK